MRRLKLAPVILLLLVGAACGEAENSSPASDPGVVNEQEEGEEEAPAQEEGEDTEGEDVEGDGEEAEEPSEDTGEGAEENDDGY